MACQCAPMRKAVLKQQKSLLLIVAKQKKRIRQQINCFLCEFFVTMSVAMDFSLKRGIFNVTLQRVLGYKYWTLLQNSLSSQKCQHLFIYKKLCMSHNFLSYRSTHISHRVTCGGVERKCDNCKLFFYCIDIIRQLYTENIEP